MKKFVTKLLTIVLAGLLLSSTASATDYDFSGTFRQDNDVLRFNFSVGLDSTVTIFSSSWDEGGFDPILAIWSNSGSRIAEQDDGGVSGNTLSNSVSYSHGVWDSYYSVFLTAGNYIATVAQYNNFSKSSNLSDGFQQDGNPNFTFDLGFGGATQPLFNGVWSSNDPRTGNWAFHILNVAEANVEDPNVVPEPSTIALLGLGLASIVLMRKRTRP